MLEIPGYKLLTHLYEGASTHVYRAIREADNHSVIIKVTAQKVVTAKKAQRLRQEFAIGRKINSPYVVRYLELKQDPAYGIALIMEDDQLVELSSVVPAQGFSNEEFLAIAIPIVEGLQAIHVANIVHNDIKLSNILIQYQPPVSAAESKTPSLGLKEAKEASHVSIENAAHTIKIIDFDQASFLHQEMQPAIPTHQAVGTLAYLSPEQTGRINRSVDYRTDFYSLGIVFYKLLCGQLPFTAIDALGMIHQHLAKKPVPPHHCKTTVAVTLSQLVMKLLEKEAENRYQSCEGILHDLNYALTALKESGKIPEFKIAQEDDSSKLTLSQHLYGREKEIDILLQTFERVSHGSREVAMVTGQPGVGKSVLVQEVQKPITLKNGYFLSGKFDQLNRNIAYSALSQAFEGLIKQLLAEEEARIAHWKNQLLKALGNQAQLMVQMIPMLETLIGPQPPAQIADANQAKMVFNLTFLAFLRVFTNASHPLVLFLDDLQWADHASLELMLFVMSQPGVTHLLWLGAYRDTEVTAAQPALQVLALKKANVTVQTLTLAPLTLINLQQWIAESLRMPDVVTQPFVELIHQKTAGNPFFVKMFLHALHDQQLLKFSPKTHWEWDLTQIRKYPATENVIALMTYQIQQLPAATREALTSISCFGHRLAMSTLQIALANSPDTIWEVLRLALSSEILLKMNDEICFVHDRVQEAAYSLLAESEKARTHLTIGQRLLASPAGEEALLFDTVAQLNHSQALITEPGERVRMARLNLKAGQKAKQATTYAAALEYLYASQQWSDPKTFWITDYPWAFTWHKELAEVEYLSCHFEASEILIKDMQPHLRSISDKIDIFHLLITQKTFQGHYQDSITLSNQALQLLGSALPSDNLTEFVQKEAAELKQKLHDEKSIPSLLNAPLVSEPEKQAIFKILASVHSASYLTGTELMPAVTLMAVNLSLTSGHAPESCLSYASYGLLLCARFDEYTLGYQFGQLALQLAEKLQSPAYHCRSSMLVLSCIYPWSKSIQQLPALFASSYDAGLACGEVEYAGYSGFIKILMLYDLGTPLTRINQETLPLLQFAQNTKNQLSINCIQGIRRAIGNLMGNTSDEKNFNVDGMDEATFQEQCQPTKSFYVLCFYHILKAQIFYLYGHFDQALCDLTLAKKNLACVIGHYATAIFNWYESLTHLALYQTASSEIQKAYLQQVEQNQQQMQKWQSSCPENFAHKYYLVEAELARINNDQERAEKLYDQAIDLAHQHNFIQEHALAAELAAKYWLSRGRRIAAQGYLNIALNGYKLWGAKRKVDTLKARYADLLQDLAPSSLSQFVVNQETTLSVNTLKLLDLSSILKASHVISSEIELPKLLRSMMQLIIENTGAQKGAVLFVEPDESIFVQAEYALDGSLTTLQKLPLAEWKDGAHAVIDYVKRLRQPVVLDNAITYEQFKSDPYINRTQAKSILCIPVLKFAELKAVLYVENNLLSHAFTAERVQTILILTTQMEISLENARYFAVQIALTKQLAEQSARAQMAEESLHAVTHDLQLALQASKAGTWNWQLGTDNITWDAANYALFGLTPEKFKGTHDAFLACVHPEDREYIAQAIKRCIEQGIPYDEEFRVIWPDGTQHVIAGQGRVYRDTKGLPFKMAGVSFDITQRKKLEQERQEALKKADEERIRREEALRFQQEQKKFTENVSHELRNPLQGMISATEFLKKDIGALSTDLMATPVSELKPVLDSRVASCKEYMSITEACMSHLESLLDDVLNLAKLEAHKMELITRVFQPKEILQSVAKMFEAKILEKKLQLQLQLPADEISVKGDAQRLKQVIINLMANALKYTEKGSITLELKVLRVTTTHTQLQFVVADTGIGMTADEKERLFKRFSQASTDTSIKYGGTGLGLEISDRFIRLMKSQIIVESKKGEGTQFSFVIECENPTLEAIPPLAGSLFAAHKPAVPLTPTKSLLGKSLGRILIADDNLVNQKLLAHMLNTLGYETRTANNGKEAVECFIKAGPFNLIFMDIEMPIMRGDEATKQIRQKEQENSLKLTPIICITGYTDDESKQQILKVGMNALLIKPFKQEDVRKILDTWVKTSASETTSHALTGTAQSASI